MDQLTRLRRELWHARNTHEDAYAARLEREIEEFESLHRGRYSYEDARNTPTPVNPEKEQMDGPSGGAKPAAARGKPRRK